MAEAERTCDKCGRTFKSDGAWYAKHALSCTGAPPARAGRIASAERTPPAAKRARPVRSTKRKPTVQRERKSKRAAPSARKATARRSPRKRTEPATGVTPAQMIAALRIERDKIDAAIASIEALA